MSASIRVSAYMGVMRRVTDSALLRKLHCPEAEQPAQLTRIDAPRKADTLILAMAETLGYARLGPVVG